MGGVWQKLTDKFLVGAGDTYSLGATGGEATVKLDFPNYQFKVWSPDTPTNPNVNSTFQGGVGYYGIKSSYSTNYNTPHNNLPPYQAVFMWQRTA